MTARTEGTFGVAAPGARAPDHDLIITGYGPGGATPASFMSYGMARRIRIRRAA